MKVSIITICYNRKDTIANTIKSVLMQVYPNVEYIVIDGGSSDGTIEIIKSYSDKITTVVSEPDQGMYHAINKGLLLATGDIIGLMHSDDEFYDSNVVSNIVEGFINSPGIDGIYGDGIYVSNDYKERIIRDRIGGSYSLKRLNLGWLPLHPTVYLKKSVIDKYGFYNVDFKIASDTEFLLRYFYKHKIKVTYLNFYFVKMRMGGLSTSFKGAFDVLIEDFKIYSFHGFFAFGVVFLKKMVALKQYLKIS